MNGSFQPITTVAEWKKWKSTLTYSIIDCFICRDRLYYGNRYIHKKTQNPVFHCKCNVGFIKDDKCSVCHVAVTYTTISIPMQQLRCTCGHVALLEVSKMDEATSA